MSIDSFQAFMNKIANTEVLHTPAIDAWSKGGMKAVLALGEREGFEFTAEDVIAVRDMPKPDASPALVAFGEKIGQAMDAPVEGELTDNQLEFVAGGSDWPQGPVTPSGNL
ncbi:MAG: Nif11-like leader peptide family natural product precursor [Burkholderiales bacterium]